MSGLQMRVTMHLLVALRLLYHCLVTGVILWNDPRPSPQHLHKAEG